MSTVKKDHDPRGWPNMCMRRQADGKPCGGWYFYLYRAHRTGIRAELLPDGGPGDDDHVCRDQQVS